MANARFQVVSLPRPVCEDGPAGASPARRYTWRFLAANNRSLASTVGIFPDVESCMAELHEVQLGLDDALCEYVRSADGKWRWTVRVADARITSSHAYARQLRARTTCETFFTLATRDAPVQVVYR